MLNTEWMVNSAAFPPGFSRDYDAHIYYPLENRARAATLREEAIQDWSGQPVWIGRLIDRNVGPHTLPMFEIDFPKRLHEKMVKWLEAHREGLSVLVHEVTGDDPRDHGEGASWLGTPIALDYTKLDPSPS